MRKKWGDKKEYKDQSKAKIRGKKNKRYFPRDKGECYIQEQKQHSIKNEHSLKDRLTKLENENDEILKTGQKVER